MTDGGRTESPKFPDHSKFGLWAGCIVSARTSCSRCSNKILETCFQERVVAVTAFLFQLDAVEIFIAAAVSAFY